MMESQPAENIESASQIFRVIRESGVHKKVQIMVLGILVGNDFIVDDNHVDKFIEKLLGPEGDSDSAGRVMSDAIYDVIHELKNIEAEIDNLPWSDNSRIK